MNKNLSDGVTQSQFFMWRTLFAVAHADHIVTDEEIMFMASVLEDVDFSDEQTKILKGDIHNAQDAEKMFLGVTEEQDRLNFFDFARDLVWVDGDFGPEEQSIMINLHQRHCREANVDDLVGKITLEFEDDEISEVGRNDSEPRKKNGLSVFLGNFARRFLRNYD